MKNKDKNNNQNNNNSKADTYVVTEHLLTIQQFKEQFKDTRINLDNVDSSKGLSDEQASDLQKTNGQNILSPPKDYPEIVKFLHKFTDFIIIGLIITAVLAFIIAGVNAGHEPVFRDNLIVATFLMLVCIVFAVLAYSQERSANKLISGLKNLLPPSATVVRNGDERSVPASELVVGDIIKLQIGSRVPADCRIISTKDLKVETSSLTGESDLIPLFVEKQNDAAHESRNIAFMTSNCMQGVGYAVVIRVGDHTMIGNINKLTSQQKSFSKSTLKVELDKFMIFITIFASCNAALFFLLGMTVGVLKYGSSYPLSTRAINAISSGFVAVLIANLPQGLPLTVSLMLTLAAKKMREVNVLIKKIEIIETIGSITFIASDKTGTLTMNQMSVENVYVNRRMQNVRSIQAPQKNTQDSSQDYLKNNLKKTSIFNLNRGSRNLNRNSSNGLDRVSQGLSRMSQNPGLNKPSLAKMSKTTQVKDLQPNEDGTYGYANLTKFSATPQSSQGLNKSQYTFNMDTLARETNYTSWNEASPFSKLLIIAAVQNTAKFISTQQQTQQNSNVTISERQIVGDATETALLRYCESIFPVNIMRQVYEKKFEIPFSSINKWALSISRNPASRRNDLVFMKGAPEWLVKKCSHYYYRGQELPINEDFDNDFQESQYQFASLGERVLGFAYKQVPTNDKQWYDNAKQKADDGEDKSDYDSFSNNMVFQGLMSIIDPPRPSVPEAIRKCHTAGIRVAMVTGDNQVTAEAIARKVGIVSLYTKRELASELNISPDQIDDADERYGAVVLTGHDLQSKFTSEEAWDKILNKQEFVFARTTPQQKLEIVTNLQRAGNLVAVTGDGVNDSPALKQSDVGVAMGNPSASDVARDAADVILLDDQFGSIVNAVEEGRRVFDNLKKSISYTITHLPVEVVPVFYNLAFGFPAAMGGILTLTIDLIAEQGNATSMVYEKAEDNIMQRPPRNYKTDRLVPAKLIVYAYLIASVAESICCTLSYFTTFWYYKIPFHVLRDSTFQGYFGPADNLPLQDYPQYTPEFQAMVYAQASAAWYLTLLLCQQVHIFHCKTRLASIYTHNIFDNWTTMLGVGFSLAVMFVCIYVPWLNSVLFFTFNPIGYCYLWFLIFAVFIHIYTETYKYYGRKDFNGFAFKYLVW